MENECAPLYHTSVFGLWGCFLAVCSFDYIQLWSMLPAAVSEARRVVAFAKDKIDAADDGGGGGFEVRCFFVCIIVGVFYRLHSSLSSRNRRFHFVSLSLPVSCLFKHLNAHSFRCLNVFWLCQISKKTSSIEKTKLVWNWFDLNSNSFSTKNNDIGSRFIQSIQLLSASIY